MSAALEDFEDFIARTRLLESASLYFIRHENEIADLLESAKGSGSKYFSGMTTKDFASELVDSIDAAELVMLSTAVEEYCRRIHGRADHGGSAIVAHCPDFKLRCHVGHDEIHVLHMTTALRDRLVHSLTSYDKKWGLNCSSAPLEILRQQGSIDYICDERHIVLGSGLSHDEIMKRYDQMPPHSGRVSIVNFCQLLTGEVVECLRAYDIVRNLKPDEAARKSSRLHAPILYY